MIKIITYCIVYFFSLSITASQISSEEVVIKNDSIELPGTLTFSGKKSPLIIWIHGSGNIDRNGNQGNVIKANYIKQFRDAVNQEGIAFFSYDKSTSNKNNFKFLEGIVFTDFVSDAQKVINHFKNDHRFSEIILAGHSQGSLIAMLASKNIDKFISIAGPGESIDKTMVKQITNQNANLGKYAAKHFKELKETGDIKVINPFLVSIFSKPNFAFLKSWAAFDPSEEIKKITVPTLIINGTKDLQVTVEDAKKLSQSKNNATLVIIDNMNHVLKNIEIDADNMKSYYAAEYPLSKELITTVVAFIKK